MSKKTKQQKHQERLEVKEKHHQEHVEQEAHLHDDDLVVAPKGMSRMKFIFLLGVTIILVLAFVIPGAIMGSLGGANPGDREYVTWERPGLGRSSMTGRDFSTEKQSYSRLLSSIFRSSQTLSDEDAAAYLLEDELARDAGIVITDTNLGRFLRDQVGFDKNTLLATARGMNMTVQKFEAEMRRWLRVRRYRNLLTQGLQFADTAEVESKWKDQFREYKFVYVQVNAEDSDEAARALVPEDAELEIWFAALPDFKRNNFLTDRKMSADYVAVDLSGATDTAMLLEQFPVDPEVDIELTRKNYYDLVSSTRFQKAAPDGTPGKTPEESEGESDGEDEPEVAPLDLTIPYEEVMDACAAEAPIYYAVHRWLTSVSQKDNDPLVELDFAAEVEAVGLTLVADQTLRTQAEWKEFEPIGGERLAGMMRFAPAGRLLPTVVVSDSTVGVVRCTTVEDSKIPELADVHSDVVDAWVEEKRSEVALETLSTVYQGFLETPDAPAGIGGIKVEDEAFNTALIAAGLTQTEREWRDRVQPPEGGFEDAPAIELYLRQNAVSFILTPGQVSEPSLDIAREHAFMLRMIEGRDPELVAMKPGYINNIERTVVNQTATEFSLQAFGFEAYADRYNLELHPAPQE